MGGSGGQGSLTLAQPGDFLYTVNQLGQFLNLADPAIHHDDKGDATYSRQPGDLFLDDKLDWLDVEQGHLGDCYFAASLGAVLYADNGKALSQNMIVPRLKSGKVVSFYATFYQASGRKVRVEVDPDLLHRNTNGHVLYMRNTQTKPGYEAWSTSLIEKAYAKWHGSYEKIGNGGTAADAIHALTGKTTDYYDASDSSVVSAVEKAGKEGRAQVACTFGDTSLLIDGRSDVVENNPEPGRVILNFHVDDARATADHLKALGVTWLVELEEREGGLFGTLVDPDGNYVQIIELKE